MLLKKVNKYNREQLIAKLKSLKLLCIDVDGTLTDGGMYLDENGVAIKKFYAHDGTGIAMVKNLGIKVALVSTSASSLIEKRAKILNLDDYIAGSHEKGKDILQLCNKLNISPEYTAHIGDDVNDILGFQVVGIPICVNNSADGVEDFACYKTIKNGGEGAVREICNMILIAHTGRIYGPPYVSNFTQ